MKTIFNTLFLLITFGSFCQTSEELEMFNELNRFRSNPKSYIPLVKEYMEITEFEYKLYKEGKLTFSLYTASAYGSERFVFKEFGPEDTYNEIIKACNELLTILDTLKPLSVVEFDTVLYRVTKKHVDYVVTIKDNTISRHLGPNDELYNLRFERINYKNVDENIISYKLKSHILILLLDFGIPGRGHRLNILNPKMCKVAIAINGKTSVQNYVSKP